MAITGPFTITDVNTSNAYRRRVTRRQTKPRTLRLGYSLRDQRVIARTGSAFNSIQASATTFQSAAITLADTAAYNAAYAKFVEAVGERASWLVTLAERKQAVDMIVKRASQLLAFTRALRKGRFGDAYDALDIPRGRKATQPHGHLKKKDFAGRYLEFHFGWAPLMSDIWSSCAILGRDFKPVPLKGRGRASASKQDLGNEPRSRGTVVTKCQILADYSIENPNALLWNQMGLANPLLVAWEVVPFSFVLDWFVNVGDYLSHFTDFNGIGLSNIAVTYLRDCDEEAWYSGTNGFPNAKILRKWIWMDRVGVSTLSGPVLSFRPWKGFSVRRGAAAVSLLIQNLPKR